MKVETVRFAGTEQGRNTNPAAFSGAAAPGKDQDFLNCVPEPVQNPATGKSEFYINKLPSTATHLTTGTTQLSRLMIWSGNSGKIVSAGINAGPLASLNVDSTEIALFTTTSYCTGISETTISGVAVAVFTISDNTAWFYFADAGSGKTQTFSGTTHTNTTMDGIASTAGMYVGQLITGSGVAANTRIASVDSANQITLTLATSTSVTATMTRQTIAKIIDADFPANQTPARTIVGTFVHLDGFAFILCSDGTLWNSDINSISAYTATSFLTAAAYPDPGTALAKLGGYIMVFGPNSMEPFYNAGNVSGSPLTRVTNGTKKIGAYSVQPQLSGSLCINCDDDLYVISSSSNDGSGAITIRKFKSGASDSTPVSYGVIDKLLNDVAAAAQTIVLHGAAVFHGQQSISVQIGSQYFLYFTATQLWWRQTIYSGDMVGSNGIVYSVASSTTINKSDPHVPVYNAASSSIRTQMFELNLPYSTFVMALELIYDVRSTSGNTSMQIAFNDYANLSTPVKNFDMSTQRSRLAGSWGSARRFAIYIVDSINAPFRIKMLMITHESANA